jgi:hypothetical protein
MNKATNDNKGKSNDDYSTSKSAYELIKEFVPPNTIVYDPFYFNGACKPYMEEVFSTNTIIHEDKDAYKWNPDHDIVVSNPPFSDKYAVLEWLIKKDKPFALLLPHAMMCYKKYNNIEHIEDMQFVIGKGRIKYEKVGQKLGSANFESCWYCYKMNLPKSIIFR